MRNFSYRNPRFPSGAELAFHTGAGTVEGVCTDISQEGLLATFPAGAQQVGTSGALVLCFGERQFTLPATVTHSHDAHAGLSFVCKTEEEHEASERFAEFLRLRTSDAVLRSPAEEESGLPPV